MRFLDSMQDLNEVVTNSVYGFLQGDDNRFSLSDAKDAFQIIFWIVAGTIAILTYMRARGTVLAPIRTEVFKRQLDLFSVITTLFAGKREEDLLDYFAFKMMICRSYQHMMEDYARYGLQTDFKIERKFYAEEACEYRMVDREGASVRAVIDVSELLSQNHGKQGFAENKAAVWRDHPVVGLQIPTKYSLAKKRIVESMESPFLPQSISDLLREFTGVLENNVMAVYDLLCKEAVRLPERFPSKEALVAWGNAFDVEIVFGSEHLIDRLSHMKPFARKILDAINSYSATESLAKELGTFRRL